MVDGRLLTEKLLEYAKQHLGLSTRDLPFVRNLLLREFNLSSPLKEGVDLSYVKDLTLPDELVLEIEEFAVAFNIVEESEKNLFSTYIMGILTPLPSVVENNFYTINERSGTLKACEYFFNLCVKNNYVQTTAIAKNKKWEYFDGDKKLEITINLSKPEKDNKQTAKLLTQKQTDKYPACMICKENEGFKGATNLPARQNLRTICVKLGGEDWFVQYSPYAYFNEHLIAINSNHTPMKVDGDTITKLLDFVDYFPNYMIGSNASLPIIGGSILNHEHFQGGAHKMPMQYSKLAKEFVSVDYPNVKVGIVDWYSSVIRLESHSRSDVLSLAEKIIYAWQNYTDESLFIYAQTDNQKHNSVAPIVTKVEDAYVVELILRNNITSTKYPDGVYHAHPEYHNVKKEAIGLIEAMGLFILPGRLERQLESIAQILSGQTKINLSDLEDDIHDLHAHRNMILELMQCGKAKDIVSARQIIKEKINEVCKNILINTAVFKHDDKGQAGFERFLQTVKIQKIGD